MHVPLYSYLRTLCSLSVRRLFISERTVIIITSSVLLQMVVLLLLEYMPIGDTDVGLPLFLPPLGHG